MPRLCNVCCAEEHLLQINARLRAGESHSAIATEFGCSVDSVDRHAKNHLSTASAKPDAGVSNRWQTIVDRAEELYQQAVKTGDSRGAVQALKQLADAVASAENAAKIGKAKVGFEALDLQSQAERVATNPELMRAVMDCLVRDTGKTFDAHVRACEAEIAAKAPAESVQDSDKYVI